MTIFYEKSDVDLYDHIPSVTNKVSGQFTEGDLHGNAAKLLFILFSHGIASGLCEFDYKQLMSVYRIPVRWLKKKHIANFSELLNKIHFDNRFSLRLIGDELCDRGENDYLTLLILQQLRKKGISLDIVLSNHGSLFLESYFSMDYGITRLHEGQEQSMHNMNKLLKKNIIDLVDIAHIVQNTYLPAIKLIDYSLSKDKRSLIIFTHALAGLEAVTRVAQLLEIKYDGSAVERLIATIDDINEAIASKLMNGQFHKLYDMTGDRCSNPPLDDPILYLMWNRNTNNLYQPETINDCAITYVHGHHGVPSQNKQRICINNDLGKGELSDGSYQYVYCSYFEFNLANISKNSLPSEVRLLLNEQQSQLDSLRQSKTALHNEFSTAHEQHLADIKLLDEARTTITDVRGESLHLEQGLKNAQAKLVICQQEQLDRATEQLKLKTILNSDLELQCQLIIRTRLKPLTRNYLEYLSTQLSEPQQAQLRLDTDISNMVKHIAWSADEASQALKNKFSAVTNLYMMLQNQEDANPKQQLMAFYRQLDLEQGVISVHRDPQWMRYTRNVVIALSIILTGLLPGLAVLGIMALNGKSVQFWQSSGHSFFVSTIHAKQVVADMIAEDARIQNGAISRPAYDL